MLYFSLVTTVTVHFPVNRINSFVGIYLYLLVNSVNFSLHYENGVKILQQWQCNVKLLPVMTVAVISSKLVFLQHSVFHEILSVAAGPHY